eukprot:1143894-Pelagomonas_calceolata.AAC.6
MERVNTSQWTGVMLSHGNVHEAVPAKRQRHRVKCIESTSHTHARAHTHTHIHTHARAHTHTHTHAMCFVIVAMRASCNRAPLQLNHCFHSDARAVRCPEQRACSATEIMPPKAS